MKNRDSIKTFITHLPLCKAMGIKIVDDKELLFVLPYSDKIIGDKTSGVIHGGAITTLLDSACGAVTYSHQENTVPTATIDLRIDYMRPAKAGLDVYAQAEVYHTTRHIAFLRANAWDDDKAKPVAMAMGTFVFGKNARLNG